MMTTGARRCARTAAVVNGLLVFGPPAVLMLMALSSPFQTSWLDEISVPRPTMSRVLLEFLQFGLVCAALATVAAWRTWVHALRYQAGESHGWRGVGEAAACGFLVAVLYLAPGIVTRPQEAPPYVLFYGSAAAILGAIVGVVLLVSAKIVMRFSKSAAA
jgi:hypothetical protein